MPNTWQRLEKLADKKDNSAWMKWALTPSMGWLVAQTIALSINYGVKTLPWWVRWFPSIVSFGWMAVILSVGVGLLILGAILEAL